MTDRNIDKISNVLNFLKDKYINKNGNYLITSKQVALNLSTNTYSIRDVMYLLEKKGLVELAFRSQKKSVWRTCFD